MGGNTGDDPLIFWIVLAGVTLVLCRAPVPDHEAGVLRIAQNFPNRTWSPTANRALRVDWLRGCPGLQVLVEISGDSAVRQQIPDSQVEDLWDGAPPGF